MNTAEIKKQILSLWFDKDFADGKSIANSLARTLPDKDLLDLVEEYCFAKGQLMFWIDTKDGALKYIYFVDIAMKRGLAHRLALRQRKPIERLIEELSSNGCKRKVALREQLKNRYILASDTDKRKTLLFMLNQPTKAERIWAYSRVKKMWDEEYRESVARVFEKYGDYDVVPLIMNHFPVDYIYQHKEKLAELSDWSWVYKRIGKDYPQEVKLENLSHISQLRVIAFLKLHDRSTNVEDMLYRNIAAEVAALLTWEEVFRVEDFIDFRNYRSPFGKHDDVHYHRDSPWVNHPGYYFPRYFSFQEFEDLYFFPYTKALSLMDFTGVRLALWVMGQVGMTDAILRFSEIDKELSEVFEFEYEAELNVPQMIFDWLLKVYDAINVKRLGWKPLSERYRRLLTYYQVSCMFRQREITGTKQVNPPDDSGDVPNFSSKINEQEADIMVDFEHDDPKKVSEQIRSAFSERFAGQSENDFDV